MSFLFFLLKFPSVLHPSTFTIFPFLLDSLHSAPFSFLSLSSFSPSSWLFALLFPFSLSYYIFFFAAILNASTALPVCRLLHHTLSFVFIIPLVLFFNHHFFPLIRYLFYILLLLSLLLRLISLALVFSSVSLLWIYFPFSFPFSKPSLLFLFFYFLLPLFLLYVLFIFSFSPFFHRFLSYLFSCFHWCSTLFTLSYLFFFFFIFFTFSFPPLFHRLLSYHSPFIPLTHSSLPFPSFPPLRTLSLNPSLGNSTPPQPPTLAGFIFVSSCAA